MARAAREQFAAGGYDRVTLRAVAAQAGVDAALVAYFFGSKRELSTKSSTLLLIRPRSWLGSWTGTRGSSASAWQDW